MELSSKIAKLHEARVERGLVHRDASLLLDREKTMDQEIRILCDSIRAQALEILGLTNESFHNVPLEKLVELAELKGVKK